MASPTNPAALRPEEIAAPIIKVYETTVDELLINIARHFNVDEPDIGSENWRLRQLAQMGKVNQENLRIVARLTGQNEELIYNALKLAALDTLKSVEPALAEAQRQGLLFSAASQIPPLESPRIKALLQELQAQSVDKLNLVNTVMLQSGQRAYRQIVNNVPVWIQTHMSEAQAATAQAALNQAATDAIIGTKTQTQAIRDALQKMSNAGLTGFVDRGGHNWSPEAYVAMDVGTTVHNAAIQSAFLRNQDYGNDLISISVNPTARPGCYPYQGWVCSTGNRSGFTTDLHDNPIEIHPLSSTTYGEPAGIFGINCHHNAYPFLPGLSVLRDEVPPQAENDARYALTQRQRELEREVRKAKRDAAIAEASGDHEEAARQRARVKQKNKALKSFAKANGLNVNSVRTFVFTGENTKS